jgi:hypothetical protein
MAFTCLPAKAAEAFKKALKDKDLNISDLLTMSTEERTKVFDQFAGKQAKGMNQLFEEKLVLKNKVLGLKNFINKAAQEGRYSPEKKAQFEQLASEYRQQQQERIFNPAEEQTFLNSLADTATGSHITRAEAASIFKLSQGVDAAKEVVSGTKRSGPGEALTAEERDYGAQKFAYESYTDALAAGDTSLKTLVKEAIGAFKETAKTDKPKAVIDLLLKAARAATDASISTVASLDDSFIGRQGLLTLFTEPKRFLQAKAKGIQYHNVWWDGAHKSFSDFYKTLKGYDQNAVLWTEIYGKENYTNGSYDTARILPKNEEQYPTAAPEKAPIVGKIFRGSQAAFEGSALRMRTQLYDFTAKLAERNGVDVLNKEQIQSIGKMVNSMTSRGETGAKGGSPLVRLVLWAPKMLRAHWDVLTAHTGQKMSPFAKREAALNLVSFVATTAAIMSIANALKPGSAETDSRSTDFGKIKIGNTRFDYTGGAASLIVLASRIATLSSKSSSTGLVNQLNTGKFGSQTAFDVMVDFLVGKTTPAAGAVAAALRGADYKGDKPTLAGTAQNLTVPITVQNVLALKDDHSVSAVIGVLLDGIGINATTYSPKTTDWSRNPGVELQAFQKKVGDTRFKEANAAYDTAVAAKLQSVLANPKYQALSDTDKTRALTKAKDTIKTSVFKQYGFVYKQAPTKKLPNL